MVSSVYKEYKKNKAVVALTMAANAIYENAPNQLPKLMFHLIAIKEEVKKYLRDDEILEILKSVAYIRYRETKKKCVCGFVEQFGAGGMGPMTIEEHIHNWAEPPKEPHYQIFDEMIL